MSVDRLDDLVYFAIIEIPPCPGQGQKTKRLGRLSMCSFQFLQVIHAY